jgi:hypothetical protein
MLCLGVFLALNLQAHGAPLTGDLSKLVNAVKSVDTWKLLLPFIFIGVFLLWQVIERMVVEKCPHCKYPIRKPSEWGARQPSDINCPKCGGKLDEELGVTDEKPKDSGLDEMDAPSVLEPQRSSVETPSVLQPPKESEATADSLRNSNKPTATGCRGWGYTLACVLLPLSIALYITSLTMNVARVEGIVEVNEEGVTKMMKTQIGDDMPLDMVADEITGLIREEVWKLKQEYKSKGGVEAMAADRINIGDISRTMNKEVKARGASLIEDMMPSVTTIKVPDPKPQVQEIKLLRTIRNLYMGTKTSKPDAFLATCILLFTVFFPISKYLALGWIMVPVSQNKVRNLNWLKTWGQWSMGDVFVIAFMVTFLKINTSVISTTELATIRVHVDVLNGMYIFGGAIILSMIASMLVTRFVREMSGVSEAV